MRNRHHREVLLIAAQGCTRVRALRYQFARAIGAVREPRASRGPINRYVTQYPL